MKIFYINNKNIDGGIVQLINKEKMMNWPPEIPILIIEKYRKDQLSRFTNNKLRSQINKHLDELVKDVAIPLMAKGLETENSEEKLTLLTRLEEITRKKTEIAKPIIPYIEKLLKDENEKIKKLAQKALNNFEKAKKKKQLEQMRKKMEQQEKDWLEEKVSNEEYASERKKLLKLQAELGD